MLGISSVIEYVYAKGCVFLSDRAVMKRRVRGLLHRKWVKPLCALIVAGLPMLAAIIITTVFMRPFATGLQSLWLQFNDLVDQAGNLAAALLAVGYHFHPDMSQLVAGIPAFAMLVGAFLLLGLPISVSVSGYFLAFLRGKEPKVKDVFSCFSGNYPRILGGLLYMLLWMVLWSLLAFVSPFILYTLGLRVMTMFAEQLGFQSLYIMPVLVGFCIVWFVAFTVQFCGRVLAYSLTGICLSANPLIPARRAVRLSRKLMRGNKWQLISLLLSFLSYYVPALVAGAALLLLPALQGVLGLTDAVLSAGRIALYAVIGANLLVTLFVAPYLSACLRAFYIERKREALMDDEVTQLDFAPPLKAEEKAAKAKKAKGKPSGDKKEPPLDDAPHSAAYETGPIEALSESVPDAAQEAANE